MKTKLIFSTFLGLALAARLSAAPLLSATPVHAKPDAASPTIIVLKAGAEAPKVIANSASTPTGWMAVEVTGPFEAFVENKDLTKSLDVKPGATIRLNPKADAPVLSVAEKDDKVSITGLRGRWTQINLEKKIAGYVDVSALAPAAVPAAAMAQPIPVTAPLSPPPVSPNAYGVAMPGQASAMVNMSDANSLPRQFAGKFVSTRRPFTPRRPYDYALNDDAGKRYAYLDVSKLLLTDQIEKYIDHAVVVFGAAKATADGKDIVIAIETLQLK